MEQRTKAKAKAKSPSWASIPIAFSVGWGIVSISNMTVTRMPAWSSEANTTAISGQVD